VTAAIVAARLLPVLRVADAREAQVTAERVIEAGLRVVELTATTRGWEAAARAVRDDWPGAVLGVGTLRSGEDAKRAVDAGADFLVTPWPAPDVRAVADAEGALLVEGGFTPAEVAAAAAKGPAKLFPAHVGGPRYLRSLLAVLPGAAIVPTGGIPLHAVPDYLAAGAAAVGVGSDLFAGGDVAGRVRAAVEAVA
jgi:2-dehydro-3-deoxyphosphogluconate aldolase/(4S)-4-hydroxy-2-oxoglutarate aldolase